MVNRSASDHQRPASRKPTVAFHNHNVALANIELKVDVLAKLTKAWGRGAPLSANDVQRRDNILRLLPKSIRQFNAWKVTEGSDLSQFGLPLLRTNAHQTLIARPQTLALAEAAVTAVRSLKTATSMTESRQSTVASLKRRIALANTLRTISERELIAAKRARQELMLEVAALKAQLAALERETRESIGRLVIELETARAPARSRAQLKSI